MAEVHLPGGEAVAHPQPHLEERDVNIRAFLCFGAGLVVTAIVIHALVWLLFVYFNAREAAQPPAEYPLAIEQEKRLPPEPRLQTNPREDLRELRAGEDELLTTYGWVDRNAGVVRIPIDEAMKLVIQRGLPARSETKK